MSARKSSPGKHWGCPARSGSDYRPLAESLGKSDKSVDEAWYDEAEDRLAAYDRGEIPSVTLDEMIEAQKKR